MMEVTGEMLIGSRSMRGQQGTLRAVNPATGEAMEPSFGGGSARDVDEACRLAAEAFDVYRATSLEQRARFLEAIADGIVALGDTLIERVMSESGLPRPRIEGERARTAGQLKLFASVVREGRWLDVTIDPALPERKPLPRADLRLQRIPVGPVAVFGASNFPLAFSVAGGDTASALAAGCPVVAKSHPSHLGTSELVGRAIQKAVKDCRLPEGVFSLVFGEGNAVGEALVQHPAIQAVGFTGSRRGGRALVALAAGREVPIPVFAEMSSINPVFLLPGALDERAEAIGRGLIDSVTLGVGQFCTKPGVVVGVVGEAFERFRVAAQAALEAKPAATMLNAGIHGAYKQGTASWASEVKSLASGSEAAAGNCAQPMLFSTDASHFLRTPELSEEVFGPAALLIECSDTDEMVAVAERLSGQLTATMHIAPSDYEFARELVPLLERRAGRLLVNGFPTGVEVTYAMVHGGPSPATSDSRFTSVGASAIDRFLRPVCYQDFPQTLLPETLRDANALDVPRLVSGKVEQPVLR
jgi:NADP-dependent aldehyde dehydrogenase